MTESADQAHWSRRFLALTVAVSLALTAAFTAAVFALARWGGPAVDAMPDRIAEIKMEQGERYEKAGDADGAIDAYRAALHGRFTRPRNELYVLARLGKLLYARKDYDGAIEYLRRAVRRADVTTDVCLLFVEALLHKPELRTEAMEAAKRWEEVAARRDEPDHVVMAQEKQRRLQQGANE